MKRYICKVKNSDEKHLQLGSFGEMIYPSIALWSIFVAFINLFLLLMYDFRRESYFMVVVEVELVVLLQAVMKGFL